MLKTFYRMSSPDVFSKKVVLLQICFIFLEEYPYRSVRELTLLHGRSPVNWLNVEHLSWKTPLGDCFCINGSEYNRCQPTFTSRFWFIIYTVVVAFSMFLCFLDEVVNYLFYSKRPTTKVNWWIHLNHISPQGTK